MHAWHMVTCGRIWPAKSEPVPAAACPTMLLASRTRNTCCCVDSILLRYTIVAWSRSRQRVVPLSRMPFHMAASMSCTTARAMGRSVTDNPTEMLKPCTLPPEYFSSGRLPPLGMAHFKRNMLSAFFRQLNCQAGYSPFLVRNVRTAQKGAPPFRALLSAALSALGEALVCDGQEHLSISIPFDCVCHEVASVGVDALRVCHTPCHSTEYLLRSNL